MPERPKLGEILIRRGVITPDQLADALEKQRRNPQLLGQILIASGYCSPYHVMEALVEQASWLLEQQETALQAPVIDIENLKRQVHREHLPQPNRLAAC